jgi:hypothetical protein
VINKQNNNATNCKTMQIFLKGGRLSNISPNVRNWKFVTDITILEMIFLGLISVNLCALAIVSALSPMILVACFPNEGQ